MHNNNNNNNSNSKSHAAVAVVALGGRGDVQPLVILALAMVELAPHCLIRIFTHPDHCLHYSSVLDQSHDPDLHQEHIVFSPIGTHASFAISKAHRLEQELLPLWNCFQRFYHHHDRARVQDSSSPSRLSLLITTPFCVEALSMAEAIDQSKHIPCAVISPFKVSLFPAPEGFSEMLETEFAETGLWKTLVAADDNQNDFTIATTVDNNTLNALDSPPAKKQRLCSPTVCRRDVEHWLWRVFLDDVGLFREAIGLPAVPFLAQQESPQQQEDGEDVWVPDLPAQIPFIYCLDPVLSGIDPADGFPASVDIAGCWTHSALNDAECCEFDDLYQMAQHGSVSSPTSSPQDLIKFIRETVEAVPRKRLVLITFGSMTRIHRRLQDVRVLTLIYNFFARILELLAARGIWHFPSNDISKSPLDDIVRQYGHHQQLMIYCGESIAHGPIMDHVRDSRGFVCHHGGSGTVSSCVQALVPQVVVPFEFDQVDWAYRVQEILQVGHKLDLMSLCNGDDNGDANGQKEVEKTNRDERNMSLVEKASQTSGGMISDQEFRLQRQLQTVLAIHNEKNEHAKDNEGDDDGVIVCPEKSKHGGRKTNIVETTVDSESDASRQRGQENVCGENSQEGTAFGYNALAQRVDRLGRQVRERAGRGLQKSAEAMVGLMMGMDA